MSQEELRAVFERLRDVLEDETEFLNVIHDSENHYEVRRARRMFADVALQRSVVRFHLRPLVRYPHLMQDLPEDVRRHAQGPADFLFKSLSDGQVRALEVLVRRAFEAE